MMKNLDPRTLLLFFIRNFLGTAYIIPFWFIGIAILEKLWVTSLVGVPKEIVILLLDISGLVFLFLLMLGCYYWGWLTFSHFTYELAADGFHIRRGVFLRHHIHIRYQNIETVELMINQYVARMFQLYTVHIVSKELLNTEGVFQQKQDEHIVGLSDEEAKSLRAELLRYSQVNVVPQTDFKQ